MEKGLLNFQTNCSFDVKGFYLSVPSKIKIKIREETKVLISGKTELDRLCWVRPRLQLEGRLRFCLRTRKPEQARVYV